MYFPIQTKWNEGFIESELIGPSIKWKSIHWKSSNIDPVLKDSVKLNVLGVKLSGEIDTLIANLPPDSSDIFNLEYRINAKIYPFLKLAVVIRDDSFHTPTQLKRWQVIYDGVPETALNPSIHFAFHKDLYDRTFWKKSKKRLSE